MARRASRPCVQTFVMRKTWSRLPLSAFAHPVFRFAAVIFPAVVEERDAAVDRLRDDPHRRGLVLRVAQMMSAQTQRRDVRSVPFKRTLRDRTRGLHYRNALQFAFQWGQACKRSLDEIAPNSGCRYVRRFNLRNLRACAIGFSIACIRPMVVRRCHRRCSHFAALDE